MTHTRFFLALLIVAATSARADVEFYSDIVPLLQANCIVCHAEDGVSFSYEDPEAAYALRFAIASAVEEDRMPPWLAEPGHQQYVDDYSLTPDEKALIAAWAAAGFPKETPEVAPEAVADVQTFDADLSLVVLPEEGYLPTQDRKDDYRCFVVDWPYDTDKYITGFKADPGNLRVAHHLVAHSIGPEAADVIRVLSEEEEGEGHQCFGGPLPDRLGAAGEREKVEERFPGGWQALEENNFWVSHWAPGIYGIEFPEETGILMRPGSVLVVQMHYYSAFAPGESDRGTVMHFQLEDKVAKPSLNIPVTDNRWLYGARNQSMQVPPGGQATYETAFDFDRIAKYSSHMLKVDPEAVSAIELQSANIHMHAFGASGRASLVDADGRKETLLNIPRWDLDWQRDFMFTEGKLIPRDEFADTKLVVECTFSNYTDEMVYGGYGSYDEMCFNFSYVSLVTGDVTKAAAR